jgi:hypothetical protein
MSTQQTVTSQSANNFASLLDNFDFSKYPNMVLPFLSASLVKLGLSENDALRMINDSQGKFLQAAVEAGFATATASGIEGFIESGVAGGQAAGSGYQAIKSGGNALDIKALQAKTNNDFIELAKQSGAGQKATFDGAAIRNAPEVQNLQTQPGGTTFVTKSPGVKADPTQKQAGIKQPTSEDRILKEHETKLKEHEAINSKHQAAGQVIQSSAQALKMGSNLAQGNGQTSRTEEQNANTNNSTAQACSDNVKKTLDQVFALRLYDQVVASTGR